MSTFDASLSLFRQSASFVARQQAARVMAQEEPDKAWPLLRDAFLAGQVEVAIPGLLILNQPRCVRLLQRALLEQGGSPDVVSLILVSMGQMGAFSELVELVEDPFTSPSSRMEILELLTQYSVAETHQLFLKELSAPSLRRQILAILTLGQWRIEAAVPPLLRMLRRQSVTSMRRSLCWSLGAIGSRQAIGALQSFLLRSETSIQMEIAELLSQIPHPQLAEVLEATLAFLEREELQQMQGYLEQHQQCVLQDRAAQLEPWREQWEELLFEEDF